MSFPFRIITIPSLKEKIIFDFHTENKHILSRMAKTAFIQCFHIYGVWKTDKLKNDQLAR